MQKTQLDPNQHHEIEMIDGIPTLVSQAKTIRRWQLCCDGTVKPVLLNVTELDSVKYQNTQKTEFRAEQIAAFARLIALMDKVNEGWEPNWRDDRVESRKFIIGVSGAIIYVDTVYTTQHTLAFPSVNLRDAFLLNNKDLINKTLCFL